MPKDKKIFLKIDLVDGAAAAIMILTSVFVVTFFWQATAGAVGDEKSFLERLQRKSEKRILKEREQVRFILEREAEGNESEAWKNGLAAAGRYEGNSQLHLFLARGYRERGQLDRSIREYRRAVEANRDYTDRRSRYYLGDVLRPVVKEARAVYLAGSEPGNEATVRDIYYLVRSLAGGCH